MQMQNLALARKKIVLDIEALHGFKMAAEHGYGNQIRNRGRLVLPFLNRMQRGEAHLQVRLVLFIQCETRA